MTHFLISKCKITTFLKYQLHAPVKKGNFCNTIRNKYKPTPNFSKKFRLPGYSPMYQLMHTISQPLKVALFGNVYQSKKNQYVSSIIQKLSSLKAHIFIEEAFARFVREELGIDTSPCTTFRREDTCLTDIAISIGGDGTFLGTAAIVGASGIPILGINTGHLGFLADVSPENIDESLEALCRGEYIVEDRKALAVMKNGILSDFAPYGLNEVAVLKHDNSSLIEINTSVDGQFLNNYLADGLIVCTPTGSTGYSLSVGGPILVPQSGTMCLSPVAPHSLSVRPVVVRDDVSIRLQVRSRSHNFMLSVDGRSESLPEDTVIDIIRAPHIVKVIKIEHKHFFETLRDKMMWGADKRE